MKATNDHSEVETDANRPTTVADGTPFNPSSITRPDDALLTYFIIVSALTLIGFPFIFLPLYFKYKTLRYKFDDEGISMRWGLLWQQEINLTYRRIQDIHVTRGLIERWLGLASVAVQTASGTSGAEMTIVGIKNPAQLRDFLYAKMRGAEADASAGSDESPTEASFQSKGEIDLADEALHLLREIRDDLRSMVDALPNPTGQSASGDSVDHADEETPS